MKIYLHRRADYGMVNAEGKINFDEIFASLFVINVSILMYKKASRNTIQYNTFFHKIAPFLHVYYTKFDKKFSFFENILESAI